jgi:hypothetical protein
MVYGEEFKVTTNDFLENSRYAKIAYHVATTMETVNLNEINQDQTLSHLVNLHFLLFFPFSLFFSSFSPVVRIHLN